MFDNRFSGLGAIAPTGYDPAINTYTGAEMGYAEGGDVNPDGSPAGTGGFMALPATYNPADDPYMNGTNVGPSPGYVTNNPRIYNSGIAPDSRPTDIGGYIDYLNEKFNKVNTYGRPAVSWTGVGGVGGNVGGGGGTGGGIGSDGSIPIGGSPSVGIPVSTTPPPTAPVPPPTSYTPVNNPETNPSISPDQALWLALNPSPSNPVNDYPVPESISTEGFDFGGTGVYTGSGNDLTNALTEGNPSLIDYADALVGSGSTEGFDFNNSGDYTSPNTGVSPDQALQYSLGQPVNYNGTDTSIPFDYNPGVGMDIMGYKFNPVDAVDMSTTLQDYTGGSELPGAGSNTSSNLAGISAIAKNVAGLVPSIPNIAKGIYSLVNDKPYFTDVSDAMTNAQWAADTKANLDFASGETQRINDALAASGLADYTPMGSGLTSEAVDNMFAGAPMDISGYSPDYTYAGMPSDYGYYGTGFDFSGFTPLMGEGGGNWDYNTLGVPTENRQYRWNAAGGGEVPRFAMGGGIGSLPNAGEYAAGGKLLRGPGDGMSDSIPAVIKGQKPQRAALADGEFVIPADVVSHLGNGSTEAGSRKLYAMMDKVRHARTGTKKQGKKINPDKFMPGRGIK